ncbi:hypothetical protein [Coleofasciculus sp. FACHB-129]|uniref:hypothetical protein n=1 Tax=Cyanophyceae TaxID=3028117 RepID=UPI001684E7C0|nr:hypothetical protein [Coleofasciculus sp. FACHB-129]MBD1893207.1 hypothetical protein [Coleofasciculus sp. FACHB-129]
MQAFPQFPEVLAAASEVNNIYSSAITDVEESLSYYASLPPLRLVAQIHPDRGEKLARSSALSASVQRGIIENLWWSSAKLAIKQSELIK